HDWFADRYVVVARRDHPRLAGAPTLGGYLAERHAVVTPWNEDSGVIDRLLARSGLRREVAVQLPTVLAALFLAGSTDFLLTAPRHAARALAEAAGLALYPAPFDIPPYVLRLYSHVQHVGRDAHAWMIGQLKGLDISRTG
ncbi:LysR substrate-binding domain-containing protein, partial [Pseudomonas aeruginosa]|nr:LysR substrate-binding domain-containing protein [Pseudomonas aeruginosa]